MTTLKPETLRALKRDLQSGYELQPHAVRSLVEDHARLTAENAALRDGLKKFGKHKPSCAKLGAGAACERPCSCGLNDVTRSTPPSPETGDGT